MHFAVLRTAGRDRRCGMGRKKELNCCLLSSGRRIGQSSRLYLLCRAEYRNAQARMIAASRAQPRDDDAASVFHKRIYTRHEAGIAIVRLKESHGRAEGRQITGNLFRHTADTGENKQGRTSAETGGRV